MTFEAAIKIVRSLAFITIIFLPAYIIRCRSFSWCSSPLPFTLTEVLILATFTAWFILVGYSVKKGKESPLELLQRLKTPLIWPIAAFLITATISLIISSDVRGGLGVWKAYFLEGFLLYIVVIDLSVRSKNYFWVIEALILSGLFVSFVSLIKFLFFFKTLPVEQTLATRISSIYEFANAVPLYLGPIAALSAALVAFLYKNLNNRNLFYLSILSLFFILAAVLLSQSKGGMVGLFSILVVWAGWMIYKMSSSKVRKYLKYGIGVFVILYFLIGTMVFVNIDEFAPKKRLPSNSLVNRYCIWQGTRNLLNDKPLTGSGINGFHADYDEYKKTESKYCLNESYFYPHNIILTFWAETGLAGLISFIWLTFTFFSVNSKGRDQLISAGLLASFAYIFIHGIVDVPFFKNDLSVEFWLLLALASVNYKLNYNL